MQKKRSPLQKLKKPKQSCEEPTMHGENIPGELLEFDFGPLSHWGVYLGNGEVVHFSWPGKASTSTLAFKVSSVVGFSKVYTNRSYDLMLDALPQDEILYRCLIFVDRTLPYHILKFNCEHFATFVRYGKARSQQGKRD
uniref:LRAT domain-containing protein n=1 Tax=Erpetoichthys calabaricus TaxID=27687 RepID=A0A8C4RTD8_ERPCA